MTRKLIGIIAIFGIAIFMNTIVNAKYIIENKFEIANINIDRTKPIIEIIKIENSNRGYEKYANKTHTIEITAKFIDKNIDKVFCDKEHIKIKINNTYVQLENMQFIKLNEAQEEKTYKIVLRNINENGKLKIEFIEGTVIDTSKLENDKKEIDTNITIDNIAPTGTLREENISEGKVNAIIKLNEEIRKLEGWNLSENKLEIRKEFTNNISYELPILDYAGNARIIKVNITKATYINLIYASHNSEVGWTYGHGNYDIAGKEAIDRNSILKTEAIAFNFSGNVDNDFIQANSYIYTHWGEGTYGKWQDGIQYKYGYNPSQNSYKSMNSKDLVTIDGKKYFQFGGQAINMAGNTDTNGNNPIPADKAVYYPYGVCGLKMILKDYSYYSIIYQIFVDRVGWINASSDGQECMYSKTKPMSAFRIALVPKSEKQYIIDTWNKDV